MIVIIDGTGPSDDKEYAKEMGNSFPSQISKQVVGSTYFRGPSLTGSEVSQIADRAVGAAQGAPGPIVLVGYSRGGCTAIITAKRLKAQGKRVRAMFLFDAVDMQTSELGLSQTIPDNVDFVAHARTARSVGFWIRNPVKSRFYFYNTGRWLDGDGVLEERKFVGTHGAAGGVPWADVVGDRACALAVAEWMNGQLKSQGVNVTLKA
ncbi:thioesterase domain-containing protein [Caulobacter segnis]